MLRAETAHALKLGEVILTLGNVKTQLPGEPRGRAHGHQRLKIAFIALNNIFLLTFHTPGKPPALQKMYSNSTNGNIDSFSNFYYEIFHTYIQIKTIVTNTYVLIIQLKK